MELKKCCQWQCTPTQIERVQEKTCCAHPHEWCNPDESFVKHNEELLEKKEFRKEKLDSLQSNS